ncbi:unnamed protein product [Musa banksii]
MELTGPEHVLVDISSDEEYSGPDRLVSSSFDWVDELHDRVDERQVEESDDVVFVDEFSVPVAKRRKPNSDSYVPGTCGASDGGDDDCLVLDSGPDKPVAVVHDKDSGGEEEDDLLVVAEKGQLACRDYPHSRHLCANFPFSTSPHKKYCDLCHCYVCDSPAPCNYWGNGDLGTDHCHSTDKGRWKSMRQSFKQKNMLTVPPQKFTSYNSALNIPPPQDSVRLHHFNPVPLRPNLLQPCSATISNPDAIHQRNQYRPSTLSYRQRPLQQQTKFYQFVPRVQHVQKEGQHSGALTTQLMNSRSRFRRSGMAQAGFASMNNHSDNTISSNNHVTRAVPQKSTHATVTSQIPCPPEGQQRSQDLLIKTSVVSVGQMQTTAPSQFQPAKLQRSVCPTLTAADFSQKSWQDILASVASELGVSNCSDSCSMDNQQAPMLPSPSQPCDESFSEIKANVDVHSAAAMTTNLSRLDHGSSLSSNTMSQIPEHVEGEDPDLVSNTTAGENWLDSLLASIEN